MMNRLLKVASGDCSLDHCSTVGPCSKQLREKYGRCSHYADWRMQLKGYWWYIMVSNARETHVTDGLLQMTAVPCRTTPVSLSETCVGAAAAAAQLLCGWRMQSKEYWWCIIVSNAR